MEGAAQRPPEGRAPEGVVEVQGTWPALQLLLKSRLAETISVRIGEIFSCKQAESLLLAAKSFVEVRPLLLPLEELLRIPVQVRSWDSRLRAGRAEAVIVEALRECSGDRGESDRMAWNPYGLGLMAWLQHDFCSMELNITGRLAIRPYVFEADAALYRKLPALPAVPAVPAKRRGDLETGNTRWSLLSLARDLKSGKDEARDMELVVGTVASGISEAAAVRSKAVATEWHGTRDLASTYAAALLRLIPLQQLLSGSDGLVIWDPFCGNGSLLLEALSVALGLAPTTSTVPLPMRAIRAMPIERPQADASLRLGPCFSNLDRLTLVGSDRSPLAILRARRLLQRFSAFYANAIPDASSGAPDSHSPTGRQAPALLQRGMMLDEASDETTSRVSATASRRSSRAITRTDAGPAEGRSKAVSQPKAEPSSAQGTQGITVEELRSFSSSRDVEWGVRLPCEASLNVASYEQMGPFLTGALLITHVPTEVHALGPTPRVAKLYRDFGNFIAGRKDWLGVYVITDSKIFRRHSRLSWEVLGRFTDHARRKCQLLYWNPSRPHGHSSQSSQHSLPTPEGREAPRPGARWQQAPRRRTLGRQKHRPGRSRQLGE